MVNIVDRLPRRICEFISRHIYEGRLKSHDRSTRTDSYNFVDIPEGEEVAHGFSYKASISLLLMVNFLTVSVLYQNIAEAETCIELARALEQQGKDDFRIITLYSPQRDLIEANLQASGLPWKDKVFCVDSFQGMCTSAFRDR